MELNDITYAIRGAAFAVHTALGPGLLETTYETCLLHELRTRGHRVSRQLALPLQYRELIIEDAFRIDLLVEDRVIVELKSVERLTPQHTAQLLTYLKLAKRPLGLLINFNEKNLQNGIKRYVL